MIDNSYDPISEMPGAFHETPPNNEIHQYASQQRPFVLKGNNSTIGGPHKIQSFIKNQPLYPANNDQLKAHNPRNKSISEGLQFETELDRSANLAPRTTLAEIDPMVDNQQYEVAGQKLDNVNTGRKTHKIAEQDVMDGIRDE